MVADCKIQFAKWSLLSYMGIKFTQAAVQHCTYSSFQALLFIGPLEITLLLQPY